MSGLEYGLDLQVDGDLVGYHRAAVLHRGAEVHVEVTPVDLRGPGEACPGAAEGVRAEAVELELERHLLGHALEGELAVHDEVAAVGANARRAVGHRGVRL